MIPENVAAAFDETSRPKDVLDIRNLIAVQGLPDEEYLRRWARTLGVEDRLDRVMKDPDFPAG